MDGAHADVSDRNAPARDERPAAKRVSVSHGPALSLGITHIALVHMNPKPGVEIQRQSFFISSRAMSVAAQPLSKTVELRDGEDVTDSHF